MNRSRAMTGRNGLASRRIQPAPRKPCAAETNTAKLRSLKDRLLFEAAGEIADQRILTLLRLAANEAESLAWESHCPILTLPLLLEEKIEFVRNYARRQARIGNRRQIQVASHDAVS